MSWVEEILAVLAYRQRSLWMLVIGLFFASITLMFGQHMIEAVSDNSMFGDAIKDLMAHKADKAALGILLFTFVWAIKFFLTDRKRLFSL